MVDNKNLIIFFSLHWDYPLHKIVLLSLSCATRTWVSKNKEICIKTIENTKRVRESNRHLLIIVILDLSLCVDKDLEAIDIEILIR